MNPKLYLVFFIVEFCINTSVAQNKVSPGGVRTPIVWYQVDINSKTPQFKSAYTQRDTIVQLLQKVEVKKLNFNSAIAFQGAESIVIPLGDSSWNSTTFFTVFKSNSKDTNEEGIWHLSTENSTGLVLTNKRVADLDSYKYMNYHDQIPSLAKVNTYTQFKRSDSVILKRQYWKIGVKPKTPDLPISSFKGLIPEFIAYKTVLNNEERLKVASYLAIKYGITLSAPDAIYLNSQGNIIWNGFSFKDYYNNIAGIGRDDASGLLQKKSTSSNTPDLLTISTESIPDDLSFLFWGENGRPFTKALIKAGISPVLQKKWLLSVSGFKKTFKTQIILDTRAIDIALPIKPVYWLAIDRTGEDDFSSKEAEFIKMDSIDKEGKAFFNNVLFGNLRSNQAIMGFVVTNEVFFVSKISKPTCNDLKSGSLQVKILGGRPPFRLRLEDYNGYVVHNKITSNLTERIDDIAMGQYTLTVWDALQYSYTEVHTINNIDAVKPITVEEQYILKAGNDLVIKADSLMPSGLTYQWFGPDGFKSFSPEVRISQTGKYRLICSANTCKYEHFFDVVNDNESIFQQVLVYPNPSEGDYIFDISMKRPTPVEISIYSESGHKVSSLNASGNANYRVAGYLQTPGFYIVTFQSGTSIITRKIFINK